MSSAQKASPSFDNFLFIRFPMNWNSISQEFPFNGLILSTLIVDQLPEHSVTPTRIDAIQDVSDFPDWK